MISQHEMQQVNGLNEISCLFVDSATKQPRDGGLPLKVADVERPKSLEPTSRDLPKSLNENHDAAATKPTSAGGSLSCLCYRFSTSFFINFSLTSAQIN